MVDEQEMALRRAEADAWYEFLATPDQPREAFMAAFDRWITAMDAKHAYLRERADAHES